MIHNPMFASLDSYIIKVLEPLISIRFVEDY